MCLSKFRQHVLPNRTKLRHFLLLLFLGRRLLRLPLPVVPALVVLKLGFLDSDIEQGFVLRPVRQDIDHRVRVRRHFVEPLDDRTAVDFRLRLVALQRFGLHLQLADALAAHRLHLKAARHQLLGPLHRGAFGNPQPFASDADRTVQRYGFSVGLERKRFRRGGRRRGRGRSNSRVFVRARRRLLGLGVVGSVPLGGVRDRVKLGGRGFVSRIQ